jgi:hypothetical protein
VERRVKQMQSDAATTVKSEQAYKQYETRAAEYQRRYAEATARGASEEEIFKLADELKEFNAQIKDNKATFDFAAKNYLDTVKAMPQLYGDVYQTAVPAKQKYYSQLVDFRTTTLMYLLDSSMKHKA